VSTTTRNYRLVQPLQTEEGKVQTYNDNFGKIEAGRTLQRVAGVTVAQYQAVYLDGLGKMQLATDSSASPRFIVAVGANASAIGYCQVEGVVTNGAWTWTVGGLVYCHASTGGALTQTAPGPTSIPIGVAVSATELFLLPFWITGAYVPLASLTSSVSGYKVGALYSGAGAPSVTTLVAGSYAAEDLYWDATNKLLYVCNTAGNATTSVWQVIGGIPTTALTSAVAGYKVEAWYTGAGVPAAGTLAAGTYNVGDRYWDSTAKQSYICNATGSATTSVWQMDGGGGGGGSSITVWAKIAEHDTVGAAEASFTWSGLDGDADVEYMILGRMVSDGTSDLVYVQPNADATAGHYTTAEDYSVGGTPAGGAVVSDVGMELCSSSTDSGTAGTFKMLLSAKSGYKRSSSTQWSRGATATGRLFVMNSSGEWTDTAANITSLKVITSAGGAHIGIGSHFELWALRPMTVGQPAITVKVGSGNGTDYTNATTSYADMDGTNLAYTVTVPLGAKATITVDGEFYQSTGVADTWVAICDGTTVLREKELQGGVGLAAAEGYMLRYVFTGDGASHTFKPRFKTSNVADAANIVNASATRLTQMEVRVEASS